VRLGVRQAESAAEHVTDLVMQAHRGEFQRHARRVGAAQRQRARVHVAWPREGDRQGPPAAQGLVRRVRRGRARVHRVHRFHGVRGSRSCRWPR
jgi:hypothetical protein